MIAEKQWDHVVRYTENRGDKKIESNIKRFKILTFK